MSSRSQSRRRSPDELAELADELAPRVTWERFYPLFANGRDGFRQGDHVTIIGPTGFGKTTLALEVVNVREYVLGLFTKPRDPLIDTLPAQGWRVTRQLDIRVQDGVLLDRRVAFHPIFSSGTIRSKRQRQAEAIQGALDYAFDTGGWCVLADETIWLVQHLKLNPELEAYWYQGRTSEISLVTIAQRPRHIPLAAYSQVEHLFLFHNADREDLRRLAEVGGNVDTELVRFIVSRLERYEFLYIGPHGGVRGAVMLRSMVADPVQPAGSRARAA